MFLYLGSHVICLLLPLTVLGYIGPWIATAPPAFKPFYELFSLPGTLVLNLSLANTLISFIFLSFDTFQSGLRTTQLVPPAWSVTMLGFPVLMLCEIFFSFIFLFIFCSSHCSTHLPVNVVSYKEQVLCLSYLLLPSLSLELCATHSRCLKNNCWINKTSENSSS